MAEKTPVRVNYDGSDNAIGFAEFQASDFIGIDDGGTGAITAAGARTALGLSIGSDIQAYDADLATIAGLSHTDGAFIVSDGSNWVIETGNTARTSLGLGSSSSPSFNGLTISSLSIDSVTLSTIVTEAEGISGSDDDTSIPTTAAIIDYVTTQVETADQLSELSDVSFGTLASGDVLRYDGANWINDPLNLATDTVGDYVESIIAGSGLAIDVTTGEQQTPTLSVNVDDSSIEISADTLQVKASGVTNAMLANSSVTINTNSLSLGGSLTLDTDDIGEGSTNLYYTQARFDTAFSAKDTDDLTEGSINVYFTDDRANTAIDNYVTGGTGVTVSLGEISIGQSVATTADVNFATVETSGNVTVGGNLTVSGTTTTVNTETINLADNIILLNSNATGTPSENAGIEVERGDSTNVQFFWDEANDRWSTDGGTLQSTIIGNVTGDVTGTVSDLSNHNTDDLTEGSTNQYYTDVRARGSVSTDVSSFLTYNSTTGVFSNTTVPIADLEYDHIYFSDGTNTSHILLGGTLTFTGGTGVTVTESSGTVTFDFDISEVKSDIDEYAQDALNDAFTAGTQTRITVSYDDASNSISYTVDDDLSNYDNTSSAFITLTDLSATTATGVTYNNTTGVIALASIPNSSLTNSSVTLNGNSLSLGGSLTLDTGDITEGSNLYYTDTRFDTRFATKDTDDLTEGSTNLYYTSARFDTDLATKDTDDLTEGASNLYYTDARVESYLTGGTGIDFSSGTISIDSTVVTESSTDTLTNKTVNFEDNTAIVEFAVTVSNASGSNKFYLDGELAASIQLIPGITYRFDLSDGSTSGHPFALSETKDGTHGGGSSYTTGVSTNGSQGSTGAYLQIEVDAATADTLYYYCTAHSGMANDAVISVQGTSLSASDTDDLAEGSSNLYYTDARARGAISVTDSGGDGSLSYNSSTGVITYTGPSAAEVQAHITAGTGVTISSGQVSIGQAVSTTSDVTFNDLTVSGDLIVSGTTTTVNTETINLADNVILLNSNETGTPSQNGGIEIERGTDTNKTLIWNETDDKWTVGSETFVAGTFEGNVTGTVSSISNHDTDDLSEGVTNLYYTTTRFNTDFATKDTDDLSEGASNLYYTTARFDTAFSGKGAADLSYDNSDADTLTATNVKGALDELDLAKVDKSTLSSTLTFYPTDTADGSISGYYRMVNSISDTDYDSTAVNVSTGNITANDQEVGVVIADADLFTGNPGYINVHVVGNIRNTSGGSAGFYFKVFHRDSSGTETLMGTSSSTSNVTNTSYQEFYADALLTNPQEFTSTDRVVFKWFAANISGSATYDFQYGGSSPVRGNFPVQTSLVIHDQEAVDVQTDTSAFAGILSTSETTVQAALDVIDDIDTDNVPEGSTNLYYTTARANTDFDTKIAAADTDDLSEGATNLYYTSTRFDTAFSGKSTTDLSEGTNQYFTNARADARIAAADLQDLNNVGFSTPGASDDDKVVFWDNSAGAFGLSTVSGLAGEGEVNTASNIGTAGVGLFDGKVGEDLQFKNINAGSSKITITDDTVNDEVDIDLGTVSIDDLSDVDTTSTAPTDGQALKWNNTASQWEPGDASSAISQLSDVTLTSLASNEVLRYNGSAWVNISLDTDNVTEGSSNLYYTSTRANADFDTKLAAADTDDLSEGATNLYFTTARVDTEIDAYLSGGTGVTYSGGTISIGQAVATTSDVTFNDLTVSGNLTVSGTTTTVNTETINLADNTITLNSNASGSATEDGGIEIERGDDANKTLIWDETNDKWTVGSETFVAATFEGEATGLATSFTTGLTADSAPADDDLLIVYDTSGGVYKKVAKSNIGGGASGGLTGALDFTLADSTEDDIDFLNLGATGTDVELTLADGTVDPVQITSASASATSFTDGDNDTKIQVEPTTDADEIRMFTAGTEAIRIDSTGVVDLKTAKLNINGSAGTNGQVLQTDGSGNISWGDAGGSLATNDLTDVDTTGLATGDSLVYNGSNFVPQRPTNIEDADGDTRVHVEESADEDKVRIDTGGTERMIIDNNATMSANGGFFIHRTTLASGETFTISANTGTVAAGPLDIEGTVDVAGTLVVV